MKLLLLAPIALAAAGIDLRQRIVPSWIQLSLLAIGMLEVSTASLLGFLAGWLPLFLLSLVPGGVGGGDPKFSGLCGFILGPGRVSAGLLLCIVLVVLLVPAYRAIRHRTLSREILNAPFPLVPFLSAGFLFAGILL